MRFVLIRSWHIWNKMAVSRAGRPYKTLCGARPKIGSEEADTLHLHQKSCETCLRIEVAGASA